MFLCLWCRRGFRLFLDVSHLRPTWFFGGFVVWMMTCGFWFLNETGRTAGEVKGRAVLWIGKIDSPDVGIGNVWSVRVEVVRFVLGAEVVVESGAELEVAIGFVVDVLIGTVVGVDPPCKVFPLQVCPRCSSFFLSLSMCPCLQAVLPAGTVFFLFLFVMLVIRLLVLLLLLLLLLLILLQLFLL